MMYLRIAIEPLPARSIQQIERRIHERENDALRLPMRTPPPVEHRAPVFGGKSDGRVDTGLLKPAASAPSTETGHCGIDNKQHAFCSLLLPSAAHHRAYLPAAVCDWEVQDGDIIGSYAQFDEMRARVIRGIDLPGRLRARADDFPGHALGVKSRDIFISMQARFDGEMHYDVGRGYIRWSKEKR